MKIRVRYRNYEYRSAGRVRGLGPAREIVGRSDPVYVELALDESLRDPYFGLRKQLPIDAHVEELVCATCGGTIFTQLDTRQSYRNTTPAGHLKKEHTG